MTGAVTCADSRALEVRFSSTSNSWLMFRINWLMDLRKTCRHTSALWRLKVKVWKLNAAWTFYYNSRHTQSVATHCRTGKRLSSQWWQVLFHFGGRTAVSYSYTASAAFFHQKKLRCSSSAASSRKSTQTLWQWISFTWYNCIGREKEWEERAQAGLGQEPRCVTFRLSIKSQAVSEARRSRNLQRSPAARLWGRRVCVEGWARASGVWTPRQSCSRHPGLWCSAGTEASLAWLARLPSPLPVQLQNYSVYCHDLLLVIFRKGVYCVCRKVTWKNLCLFTSLASCSPAPRRFSGFFCNSYEKDEQMSLKTFIYWAIRQWWGDNNNNKLLE